MGHGTTPDSTQTNSVSETLAAREPVAIEADQAALRPSSCVRPEQSASLHAIYQGHVCSCCGGEMPADGSGSGPLTLPTANGPFPYRLCSACLALAETAGAEVLARIVTAVVIEGIA